MAQRMALYMQDKHPIRYEIEMVKYAETRGFSEIWQADTRLARDCVVMMSAFLAETNRIRFGSGVLPIWTRNPAVIAATWSTMWELAGAVDGQSRIMLGLGAWWEPIASRVGVRRKQPLKAMREHIEALRQLFTMEEVTYRGDFVQLDQVRLDVAYGDTSARDIPLYIGATGPKMLELSGEICDGVVLNYVVSVEYIRHAVELVQRGAGCNLQTRSQKCGHGHGVFSPQQFKRSRPIGGSAVLRIRIHLQRCPRRLGCHPSWDRESGKSPRRPRIRAPWSGTLQPCSPP